MLGGPAERAAAGNIVPFVLWFNFIAGFAYVIAGCGLFLWKHWAAVLSAAIAIAYSASKAAILSMTREIAVQYAAKGIRANTVLPGLMDTPMVKAQLISAYGGDVEQMGRRRAQMCPMGRQGDGWDTALAALFLASEEAKYITGTTLTVDGGLSSIAG